MVDINPRWPLRTIASGEMAIVPPEFKARPGRHRAPSAVDFSRALVHPITGLRRQVLIGHDLASLTVPTLCLWGTDDNFVKPDTVTRTLQRAAAIRLQTVDDAGHLLTFEQPDLVADAVTEFLESNS